MTKRSIPLMLPILLLAAGCATGLSAASHGPDCPAGSRPGATGDTFGKFYNVHTPADYDATVAHPLIVVYPGHGEDKDSDEPKTHLRDFATQDGFVIVFTDHYTPVVSTEVVAASRVPEWIAAKWCIDRDQIFLVGNSDGASTLSYIVLSKLLDPPPAAIVVNAVGVPRGFLDTTECPPPIPYLSMHGSQDMLFPIRRNLPSHSDARGYGAEAASWWAACNNCQAFAEPPAKGPGSTGCQRGCTGDPDATMTEYCQDDVAHGVWSTNMEFDDPDAEIAVAKRVMDFIHRVRGSAGGD